MRARHDRCGFALIDLFVCIAMAGVAVCLVLPAALRVRDHSRMADCKNRLRVIAIAAHDFHDAYMRLPPGTLNYNEPPKSLEDAQATPGLSREDCQNLSALYLLLPFIEFGDEDGQKPNYDAVNPWLVDLKKDLRDIVEGEPAQRVFKSQYEYGPGAPSKESFLPPLYDFDMEPMGMVTESVIPFVCPDDTLNDGPELPSIAITMPYYNGASVYGTPLDDLLYVAFNDMHLARTNYVASAGTTSCINVASPLAKWGGAMTGRMAVTLEQVSNLDGTSKTFMFGESLGDVGSISTIADNGEVKEFDRENSEKDMEVGERKMTRSWAWGGLAILASSNFPWGTMTHPDIKESGEDGPYLKLLGDARLADPEAFSSTHERGVNFAMCDASIHTVRRKIAWQLYYGNGGLRDGVTERGF